MEESKNTKTEKGVTSKEQSQGHAPHFIDAKGIVYKEFILQNQSQFHVLEYSDFLKVEFDSYIIPKNEIDINSFRLFWIRKLSVAS